jgi:hypothetical protein
MTLAELKQEARLAAVDLEVQWEKLDSDPSYREDFERILAECERLVPEIEQLYIRLQDRKNIFFPDQETTITYEERELFLDRLEDELFASYQVMDLWERYQLVKNITALDNEG